LRTRSFSFYSQEPARRRSASESAQRGKREQHAKICKKIGTLPREKIREIAELKMKDLTAADTDGAIRIVEGTARSMGIEVE